MRIIFYIQKVQLLCLPIQFHVNFHMDKTRKFKILIWNSKIYFKKWRLSRIFAYFYRIFEILILFISCRADIYSIWIYKVKYVKINHEKYILNCERDRNMKFRNYEDARFPRFFEKNWNFKIFEANSIWYFLYMNL